MSRQDELRRDVFFFGWPDMVMQPFHQRQIISEAAQQRHCGMRMQINESRNEDVIRQVFALARGESGIGFSLL